MSHILDFVFSKLWELRGINLQLTFFLQFRICISQFRYFIILAVVALYLKVCTLLLEFYILFFFLQNCDCNCDFISLFRLHGKASLFLAVTCWHLAIETFFFSELRIYLISAVSKCNFISQFRLLRIVCGNLAIMSKWVYYMRG